MINNIYNGQTVHISFGRLALFPTPPVSKAQRKLVRAIAISTAINAINAWLYSA